MAQTHARCNQPSDNIVYDGCKYWRALMKITFFFCQQELKKAILEDLVRLGKASGLHSFEQVSRQKYVKYKDIWFAFYCSSIFLSVFTKYEQYLQQYLS